MHPRGWCKQPWVGWRFETCLVWVFLGPAGAERPNVGVLVGAVPLGRAENPFCCSCGREDLVWFSCYGWVGLVCSPSPLFYVPEGSCSSLSFPAPGGELCLLECVMSQQLSGHTCSGSSDLLS